MLDKIGLRPVYCVSATLGVTRMYGAVLAVRQFSFFGVRPFVLLLE